MLTEKQIEKIAFYKSRNYTIFEEPHLLKIEPANYCTRKCGFCYLNKRGSGFMTLDTLNNILEGCTEKLSKIELCLSGEPLMNKHLPEMISLIHKKYPSVRILVLTNTDMLRNKYGIDYLFDLYERGMGYIQCDLYDQKSKDWFIEQLKSNKEKIKSLAINIIDYYKVPYNLYSYGKNERAMFVVNEVPGLNHNHKKTREFHTWGGNMPLSEIEKFSGKDRSVFPLKKCCTDPLKAMVIWNNGDVGLCCREGSKSIIFGNVNENRAVDIWQSEQLHMIRYVLKIGRRELIPSCFFCLYNSFRDGIHPLWEENTSGYSLEIVMEEISKMIILDEGLKQNFIDFNKQFPKKVPQHIKDKL